MTVQVCTAGWVSTVTLYVLPSATGVEKVNEPLLLMGVESPPLFCSTTVPLSADTVPPTVKLLVEQTTVTVVTFEVLMVPVAFPTVQVCAAGCVDTVTA